MRTLLPIVEVDGIYCATGPLAGPLFAGLFVQVSRALNLEQWELCRLVGISRGELWAYQRGELPVPLMLGTHLGMLYRCPNLVTLQNRELEEHPVFQECIEKHRQCIDLATSRC